MYTYNSVVDNISILLLIVLQPVALELGFGVLVLVSIYAHTYAQEVSEQDSKIVRLLNIKRK